MSRAEVLLSGSRCVALLYMVALGSALSTTIILFYYQAGLSAGNRLRLRVRMLCQHLKIAAKKEEMTAKRDKKQEIWGEIIAQREKIMTKRDEMMTKREKIIAERDEMMAEREKMMTKRERIRAKRERILAKREKKTGKKGENIKEKGENFNVKGIKRYSLLNKIVEADGV